MNKLKKTLLVFPPLWDINLAPMLSLPTLAGAIKNFGGDVKVMDMNADFLNYIKSEEFLKTDLPERVAFYEKEINNKKTKFPEKLKDKYKYINNDLIKYIQKTKSDELIQRSKNAFNQKDFLKGSFYLDKYRTYSMFMHDFGIEEDIKTFEYELFQKFFNDVFDKINDYAPDLIAFSIYSTLQYNWFKKFFIYAKKKLKGFDYQVTCGGAEIMYRAKYPQEYKFLEKNIDYIMVGQGEEIFAQLYKGIPYKEIMGVAYFENGKIYENEISQTEKTQFYKPDYSTIDMDKYFAPVRVVPIESSRGCYWGKCKFCTFPSHVNYKIKNIDDLIEEIKYYVNELHVNHFFFTDSAITPKYIEEFSKRIIEENLKIYYISFFRLEKAYTKKLLDLMYKAGLRVAMWGVESGSQDILDLYDKGTQVENNIKIIKKAHEAGIYNYCYFIYNFPKETVEDFEKTVKLLEDNYEYIDYLSLHTFGLSKSAPIYEEKDDFGLCEDDFVREFVSYSKGISNDIYVKEQCQKLKDLYKSKNSSVCEDCTMLLIQISDRNP